MKRIAQILALATVVFCLFGASTAEARGGGNWTAWAQRPWVPTDTSGAVAWFNPRSKVTNSAGKASDWTDQSGQFVVTQATAGKRPTIATGINGQPTLTFVTASSCELTNTTSSIFSSAATRYVLIVAKLATSGSGSGGAFFTFRLNTTGGRVWTLQAVNVGDGNIYYFTDAVSNNVDEVGAGATLTSPFIIEFELTAGQAPVIRINNVARTLVGTVNATGELGTTGLRIGSANNGTSFLGGEMADVFMSTGIPSAADKARLRNFAEAQSGLALTQ